MTTAISKKEINLNELLEIAQHNTLSTSAMLRVLEGTVSTVNDHAIKIKEIKEDIHVIKFNEEITDEQAMFITDKVRSLARETVGYPDPLYPFAIQDIYSHLKKNWNMGGKVRTTKKGNFDTVVQGLETYKPSVEKLKDKLEAKLNSEAKK